MKTDSDIAKAYRAARRYYPHGNSTGALRPAHLAIAEARKALGRVAEAQATYEAANPRTGDAKACGALPIDTAEGHAARAAYSDAKHKAGLFHSVESWRYGFHNTDSAFRGTIAAHDVSGTGVDHNGWYDNPHGESFKDGSGLVWGVVCQLPGRNGCARYVAGVQYGSCEGGPVLDLTTVHSSPAESSWDAPDAMRDAARAADSMAESAADKERDYQSAWGAGCAWADLGETVAQARQEALQILAERKSATGGPALCKAIRAQVQTLRDTIAEARQERVALAEGTADSYWWSWSRHDDSGLAAFAEGADLTMAEARRVCS